MPHQPLHPNALMVKDLHKSMRVTVVRYMFGEPFDIEKDIENNTLTITESNAGDSFAGFDGRKPHEIVCKTFEDCGIPDGPNGWAAYICTMSWDDASELLREHVNATRAAVSSRQLVSSTGTVLTPSWAS
ncbi:hypothetical protein EPN95_02980 [Patescibacteria group bacterium]|nr:MAG: hypothetical protein EPN95_02980 [Patescibacteria group bacterium]